MRRMFLLSRRKIIVLPDDETVTVEIEPKLEEGRIYFLLILCIGDLTGTKDCRELSLTRK